MTYDVEIPGGLAKRHQAFKEWDCDRCDEKILPPEDYYAIWRGKGSSPKERIHIKCLSKEPKPEERREVKPANLPRFPRFAICPNCGNGGEGDTTVCSYVDANMPENSPRFIGCGYCGYDGPAPDHPLYPKKGKNN